MSTRKTERFSIVSILILIFTVTSLIYGVDIYYLFALLIWLFSFIYALSDLKSRGLLLSFLIAYFVFLMGGHFVHEYFAIRLSHFLDYEYYRHSNVLIGLSLLSVLITYIVFEQPWKPNTLLQKKDAMVWEKYVDSPKTQLAEKISRNLFYSTYPFWLLVILEKVLFVEKHGYASYYTGFMSGIVYPIRLIGSFAMYAYLIFLSTLPSKRRIGIPGTLVFIYAIVSLLAGARNEFTTIFVFHFIYFLFRDQLRLKNERWISKRLLLVAVILFPAVIIVLFVVNYIRLGQSVDGNVFQMLLGFLQQQGVSAGVIRLERYYKDFLNPNQYYSFFGLLKWFRMNTVIGMFWKSNYGFSYLYNSLEYARLGNSLSSALSPLALSVDRYLEGFSLGTCYIAELFHDFGYKGIVFGNMFYGAMMAWLSKSVRSNSPSVFRIAFLLVMFESFMKAPRWNFDIVLVQMINMAMWATFGLIIMFLLISKQSNAMFDLHIVKDIDYRRTR